MSVGGAMKTYCMHAIRSRFWLRCNFCDTIAFSRPVDGGLDLVPAHLAPLLEDAVAGGADLAGHVVARGLWLRLENLNLLEGALQAGRGKRLINFGSNPSSSVYLALVFFNIIYIYILTAAHSQIILRTAGKWWGCHMESMWQAMWQSCGCHMQPTWHHMLKPMSL